MGKWKWGVSILIIGCLLGLAGCAEKTTVKKPEKSTQQVKQPEKKVEEAPKEEPKQEAPEPIVVKIIDPKTKGYVEIFNPAEMGFETDPDAYKKEIENWAKDLARGTDATAGYDQRMTLDKIGPDGQVNKGVPKVVLEEKELVEKVLAASAAGGEVQLPVYITRSGYKPEDVASLGEVVLGSYSTYFSGGATGRNKNIELSAQAIDNIIVGTGDIFSFNTTVGPSDKEHGYQPAQEIVNKQLVMGIGGGICQTSSTLFNAVDKVGVTYVEKHHHSLPVGYVPTGRDATVSYGGKDFQFQNTTGVPLLIKAIYGPGKLTIEIRTSSAYKSQLNGN